MDTLAVNEKLIAAGVPKSAAKAHAQIHAESADDLKAGLKDELATKADLQDLKVAIAEMEARISWRIVGAMIGVVAIFGVMLTILFQMLATLIATLATG